jgi:3-deoxy-D-manno-octulosonate 8-phosphate phosphatase (KDO 8-P phosphatase)
MSFKTENNKEPIISHLKNIQCLICDLDGVLTDGLIYLDNQANEQKAFNIQDGLGLKLLQSAGIEVAIITGSKNKVIDHRMAQLQIRHYFKGQINKQTAYTDLKTRLNLSDEAFAYIGDDLPDIPIMKQVGFAVAVSNAVPQVKAIAHWTTEQHGGRGAVREVCDFILTAQNKFDDALQTFLAT